MDDLSGLPGFELVESGLSDLRARRESVHALVVAIAATRLRRCGIDVPRVARGELEHRLYDALTTAHGDDAYGRYRALLARVDSFARALEREEGARLRAARVVG